MPVDPSISLQVKPIDPINRISGFLEIGRRKLELDKARATYDADVAQRQAESSHATTEADVAAQTAAPRVQQQLAQTGTAQAQMSEAQLNVIRAHMSNAYQEVQTLANKPDLSRQDIEDSLKRTLASQNAPLAAYAQAAQNLPPPGQPADVYKQYAAQKLLTVQNAMQQLNAKYPSPSFVGTGARAVPVAGGNPELTGVAPGTQQGKPIAMELPPTTPVFNPQTNAPGYLGAQQGNGIGGAARPPIQSGPALGQATTQEGIATTVQRDWADTGAAAKTAAQDIGVLQNIKQYAPGAATGITGAREAVIAGIAGRLGMTPEEVKKTNTDLLAKNANMLALAGGNTDAARTLAEAANPNSHMTPEAIQHAANQVIAQRQMAVNKQNMLLPYVNDPATYNQVLNYFNSISDPRALQFQNMSMEEKTKLKSSMNEAERKKFGEILDAQKKLGWIK